MTEKCNFCLLPFKKRIKIQKSRRREKRAGEKGTKPFHDKVTKKRCDAKRGLHKHILQVRDWPPINN